MDATHKTNWLGWLLYTILVRDQYGSWIPVYHFLTKHGDGDIVQLCLSTVRKWVYQHTKKNWLLRYILTDDSAVEQKAVQRAFPGLQAGEQEVTHLLCVVHSERTL